MSDNIEIVYKNARIKFDTEKEEWIAYLNTERFYEIGTDEFKRHASLQKLKEYIDKFNKKNFTPIPIFIFDGYGNRRDAEIISFTTVPGECWIKNENDKRELIKTNSFGFSHPTKIYASENIFNEPIVLKIAEITQEALKLEKEYKQKRGELYQLISTLQEYDISGMVIEPNEDIVM